MLTRFEKKYCPEPNSGCWLWTASVDKKGYGKFGLRQRSYGAHRISWELYRGPIPAGISVLHRCDTPSCVNPDHLWLGTVADNNADKQAKGRGGQRRGPTHPSARLNVEKVLAIRTDQRSQSAIAAEFGVSANAVSKIQRRLTWAHVRTSGEQQEARAAWAA